MRDRRRCRDAGDVGGWSSRRVADGGRAGNIDVGSAGGAGRVTDAGVVIVRYRDLRPRRNGLLRRRMLRGVMDGVSDLILLQSERMLENHLNR